MNTATQTGDERYAFVGDRDIRKVDSNGIPDENGLLFRVIDSIAEGYSVYVVAEDPSQPNPSYFIHKRYFVETK